MQRASEGENNMKPLFSSSSPAGQQRVHEKRAAPRKSIPRGESHSLFVWLMADSLCWFVLREKYCWLVAGGWFVVREKYCWLVADKPNEQAVRASQGLSVPGAVADSGHMWQWHSSEGSSRLRNHVALWQQQQQ
jgi:hypothetical protein